MTTNQDTLWTGAAAIACISLFMGGIFLWVTHVLICIKSSAWILLIFGILVPPVGLIHGFGYWAGLL